MNEGSPQIQQRSDEQLYSIANQINDSNQPMDQHRDITAMTRILATLAIGLGLFAFGTGVDAVEKYKRLTGAQIQAKFVGMEMSDDVHWRDFYERSGAFTSHSMGRKRTGKWWVNKNELCIDRGKDDGGCYQVWVAGRKVEFRRPGLDVPILEGTLQNPIGHD